MDIKNAETLGLAEVWRMDDQKGKDPDGNRLLLLDHTIESGESSG